MRTREWEKLARVYLLGELPDFVPGPAGRLYIPPADLVLRSIFHGPTSHQREMFDVYYTVIPLYVPATGPVIRLGERMPGLWIWKKGDKAAERKLMGEILDDLRSGPLEYLRSLETPADIAMELRRDRDGRPWRVDDPHDSEWLAYSLILAGDYDDAEVEFANLRRVTLDNAERAAWWEENHRRRPAKEDWVVVIGRRGEEVRALLHKDPPLAVEQLNDWARAQRAELRLPDPAPA
jgi:hypothetical protein